MMYQNYKQREWIRLCLLPNTHVSSATNVFQIDETSHNIIATELEKTNQFI